MGDRSPKAKQKQKKQELRAKNQKKAATDAKRSSNHEESAQKTPA
jgi:hypothetical protein